MAVNCFDRLRYSSTAKISQRIRIYINRGCNQNRSCGVNIGWQQEDQIQFRFDRYSLLDQKLKYQVLWRKHLKLPSERIEIERGFSLCFSWHPRTARICPLVVTSETKQYNTCLSKHTYLVSSFKRIVLEFLHMFKANDRII